MAHSKTTSNKPPAKSSAALNRNSAASPQGNAVQNQIPPKALKPLTVEAEKKIDPSQNIKVCVRVRPINIGVEDACIWDTNSFDSSIQLSPAFSIVTKKKIEPLYYDSVFYGSDNKVLYDAIVKDSVQSCMTGMNTVVFAYGQSGSGKTYSMMGYDEMPGIIPQAVDHIFDSIKKQTSDCEYLLRVSYIEIYNERIRDLLDPSQEELKLLEGRHKDVYISPLKEEIVFSPSQVMEIIQKGEQNRSWGETENNAESSRSHTIFQMIIECISTDGKTSSSQLNLIDLAGSEKSTEDLERRKEGAFINRSLLTLGTVISKLTETGDEHVPFRDSKLTRLLQKSLSGNSKICVVATISPVSKGYEESVNTLKFAARVKKIISRPQEVSKLDDKVLLEKYKSEVEHLRTKLSESHAMSHKSGIHLNSTIAESDKRVYDDELLEARLETTSLKERIAFLNKIILKASTLSTKPLIDWNVDHEKNGSSVILGGGLLPSRRPLKGSKAQSEPSLSLEEHMTEADKAAQLQDFISSLKQVHEIERVHELIDEFRSGKFEDTPDIKTAMSVKKISKLEGEKRQLQSKIEFLEKMVKDATDTTNFAEKNNSQLELVVEEQHKTIINLTKRITGIQMEFKEYREVLGRRRPPKLGEDSLAAIRGALVSEKNSKEILGFLAFLSSIEETEKRYQMKNQAYLVPEQQQRDNHSLANHLTPAVQAIKNHIKSNTKIGQGQNFDEVDEKTKNFKEQVVAAPLKERS